MRKREANRLLFLVTVVLFLASCATVQKVDVNFHPPEITYSEADDAPFREAWSLLRQGNPQKAVKRFEQSAVSPEKRDTGIGFARLAQGKYAEAYRLFEGALAAATGNLEAETGIALMHEMMGDREKAFIAYSRIVARYPENRSIKTRYELIKSAATDEYLKQADTYKTGASKEKYIRALEQASFYSPEILSIRTQIADYYFQEQNFPKCLPYYETILDKQPGSEEVLQRLAEIYEKTGKFDSALLMVDRLLEIHPQDVPLESRRESIKEKFLQLDLPAKFKNIYFKKEINREELAALIGYYFGKLLPLEGTPEIITDIDTSFARNDIMKLCTIGILKSRPDHTFDRYGQPDRAAFSVVLETLIAYLEKKGLRFNFPPLETTVADPADISPIHQNFAVIKFLVQSQIMKLDDQNNFKPTAPLSPAAAVTALQKVLNGRID
jgi:tetratricopeptide (TPR) repeat protein